MTAYQSASPMRRGSAADAGPATRQFLCLPSQEGAMHPKHIDGEFDGQLVSFLHPQP